MSIPEINRKFLLILHVWIEHMGICQIESHLSGFESGCTTNLCEDQVCHKHVLWKDLCYVRTTKGYGAVQYAVLNRLELVTYNTRRVIAVTMVK